MTPRSFTVGMLARFVPRTRPRGRTADEVEAWSEPFLREPCPLNGHFEADHDDAADASARTAVDPQPPWPTTWVQQHSLGLRLHPAAGRDLAVKHLTTAGYRTGSHPRIGALIRHSYHPPRRCRPAVPSLRLDRVRHRDTSWYSIVTPRRRGPRSMRLLRLTLLMPPRRP